MGRRYAGLGVLGIPTLGHTPTQGGRALQVRESEVPGALSLGIGGQPDMGWQAPAGPLPTLPGPTAGASPRRGVGDSSAESGSRAWTGRDCWDGTDDAARVEGVEGVGRAGKVVYEGGRAGPSFREGEA